MVLILVHFFSLKAIMARLYYQHYKQEVPEEPEQEITTEFELVVSLVILVSAGVLSATVVLITERIKGADVIYVHCRKCARGRSYCGKV